MNKTVIRDRLDRNAATGILRSMPIKPEYRWLYPIDWPQLTNVIRLERAKGRCEGPGCGRPHMQRVLCLKDGRWWDAEAGRWRGGAIPNFVPLEAVRSTKVVLATAHRDHDPTNNRDRNLVALCQRCHLRHDAAEHARRRHLTYRARYALGDLFLSTM